MRKNITKINRERKLTKNAKETQDLQLKGLRI